MFTISRSYKLYHPFFHQMSFLSIGDKLSCLDVWKGDACVLHDHGTDCQFSLFFTRLYSKSFD